MFQWRDTSVCFIQVVKTYLPDANVGGFVGILEYLSNVGVQSIEECNSWYTSYNFS